MIEKKGKYGTVYLLQIPDELCFANLESGMTALSQDRQEKIRRYAVAQSKLPSFCCAFLVRVILQRDFGMTSDQIQMNYLEKGKPVLVDQAGEIVQPHISWSHSKKAVAVAVNREPVGVDVEWIGVYREKIARKYFSQTEWEHLEQSEQKEQEFYKLWTRKEAFVKRNGEGLRKDLSQIPTQLEEMESQRWGEYMVSVCGNAGTKKWEYCVEEWGKIYPDYYVSKKADRKEGDMTYDIVSIDCKK